MLSEFASRLRDQFTDAAAVQKALDAYFATEGPDRFTGSHFELIADTDRPNLITEKDIVAASTLSVEIPAEASIWLLSDGGRTRTRELLEQVPTNIDIWHPEAEALLAEGGPLWDLWDELDQASWPTPKLANEMASTKISKLLAAKRPRLVPVWDSVVNGVLGPAKSSWQDMRAALCDEELRTMIEKATQSAPDRVSLLRRIDAVVWFENRETA